MEEESVLYLNLDKSESDNVWSVTYDCHHIVYQLTINGLPGLPSAMVDIVVMPP